MYKPIQPSGHPVRGHNLIRKAVCSLALLAALSGMKDVPLLGSPAQSEWAGNLPTLNISTDGPAVFAMSSNAKFTVTLSAKLSTSTFKVSPFLELTRGISVAAYKKGRLVSPKIPLSLSPPPPPVDKSKFIDVTHGHPYTFSVVEDAVNLVPSSGTYDVVASLYIMDTSKSPISYEVITSKPVRIKVK